MGANSSIGSRIKQELAPMGRSYALHVEGRRGQGPLLQGEAIRCGHQRVDVLGFESRVSGYR